MAKWLIAWITMFMLLFILARTRAGHTVIYYVAWLLTLLLIVTHAGELVSIFVTNQNNQEISNLTGKTLNG